MGVTNPAEDGEVEANDEPGEEIAGGRDRTGRLDWQTARANLRRAVPTILAYVGIWLALQLLAGIWLYWAFVAGGLGTIE